MNVKVLVFVICVEVIAYWLLYNLHDYTFKERNYLWNKFFADFCDSVPVPYKIGFADGNFANRIHFHYVLF